MCWLYFGLDGFYDVSNVVASQSVSIVMVIHLTITDEVKNAAVNDTWPAVRVWLHFIRYLTQILTAVALAFLLSNGSTWHGSCQSLKVLDSDFLGLQCPWKQTRSFKVCEPYQKALKGAGIGFCNILYLNMGLSLLMLDIFVHYM